MNNTDNKKLTEQESIKRELLALEEQWEFYKSRKDYEMMGVVGQMIDDWEYQLRSIKNKIQKESN